MRQDQSARSTIIRRGKFDYFIAFVFSLLFIGVKSEAASKFPLVTKEVKITIIYDSSESKLDSIAANLLADDIQRVTDYRPVVFTNLYQATGYVIIIGSAKSELISELKQPTISAELKGKWECYAFKLIQHPTKGVLRALVIAGSDFRGTAYGVFEISSRIGVTPWYWWADATPEKRKTLSLSIKDTVSAEPSVKYRGIFINDEDWGLQRPKTYAKVSVKSLPHRSVNHEF